MCVFPQLDVYTGRMHVYDHEQTQLYICSSTNKHGSLFDK